MALFENYDRRIKQIEAILNKHGIKDLEEAKSICEDKGIDVFSIIKGIQPSYNHPLARKCFLPIYKHCN